MSDAEALAVARADAANATAETERLAAEKVRLQFAHENGVPAVVADRLRGSTVEELAADWAQIKPGLRVPTAPVYDPNAPRVPAPVTHQGPQPGTRKTADDYFFESIYGARK